MGSRHHHHGHHHSVSPSPERSHSPRLQPEQAIQPQPSDSEELSSSEGSVVDVKASRRYSRVFINQQGVQPPHQPPRVIPIRPQNNHMEERPGYQPHHHHRHHRHHRRLDSESRGPRGRSRDGPPIQVERIHIRVRSTERTGRSHSPPTVVRRVITEPGPTRRYEEEERVEHVRPLSRTRNFGWRE